MLIEVILDKLFLDDAAVLKFLTLGKDHVVDILCEFFLVHLRVVPPIPTLEGIGPGSVILI